MRDALLVDCSPRKGGNSDLLSERLSRIFDLDVLHLRDYTFSPCDGCEACETLGRCRQDDAASRLYADLEERGRILFVAPIYFCGFDAHTKAFIDRSQYRWQIPDEKTRKLYLIAIGGQKSPVGFQCMETCLRWYGLRGYQCGLHIPSTDKKGDILKGNAVERAMAFLREQGFPAGS